MRARTLADLLREVNVAPQMQDTLARIVKNLGGGRMPMVFSTAPLGPLVNAVETVCCLTPPLNPSIDASQVFLLGMWNTTAIGATGTAALSSIRRGAVVASPLVSSAFQETVVAANAYAGISMAVDTPGAVAGQQYVLTGQITGGSANTAIAAAFLMAVAFG